LEVDVAADVTVWERPGLRIVESSSVEDCSPLSSSEGSGEYSKSPSRSSSPGDFGGDGRDEPLYESFLVFALLRLECMLRSESSCVQCSPAMNASRVLKTGLPFFPLPSFVGEPGAPSGSRSLTLLGSEREQLAQESVDVGGPPPAPCPTPPVYRLEILQTLASQLSGLPDRKVSADGRCGLRGLVGGVSRGEETEEEDAELCLDGWVCRRDCCWMC
jgi:hypothetical protein